MKALKLQRGKNSLRWDKGKDMSEKEKAGEVRCLFNHPVILSCHGFRERRENVSSKMFVQLDSPKFVCLHIFGASFLSFGEFWHRCIQ